MWNMSGPIFAGKEESSQYSGVNVVLVGVRGAVAPPRGLAGCFVWAVQVLILGGIFASIAASDFCRAGFGEKNNSFRLNNLCVYGV